ncbi:Solute carrier family 12 member 9 [Takifugu flavidus]|uniref:Solute carrier family 12 member 9 n=1 Tax=Takifugu flavidus TaxID=433684 RepID=A0A5C6PBN5_9TELE|nr:Solute carrier family 12 member 9 [Takifugu flavidus]
MTERTPLLHYRLAACVNEAEVRPPPAGQAVEQPPGTSRQRSAPQRQPQKLSVFFGVVIPTLLSMFSVVVFLRIGFVVGQAGLCQGIAMFLVAYFIICMTVLSVCAISTNGALDAGGAYCILPLLIANANSEQPLYMISRALGPEFGGSIGIMFFLANVCGCALFVLGLVEAVVATFGIPEDGVVLSASQVLPSGYWYSLLYATAIALLCLLVCLVGAHIYAKATFLIFLVVMVVLGTIFISFFAVGPHTITLPSSSSPTPNLTGPAFPTTANFTGFKLETLLGNLWAEYTVDYTTGTMMTFATVFAVMFNGCTGIMAGSNMSGELKNPSYSIPRGTITAVIFTFIIYNLLCVLVACSCDRRITSLRLCSPCNSAGPSRSVLGSSLNASSYTQIRCVLLQRDYSFLRDINIWHPLVTVGVYCSTLSAAMSNLIGASRILYALARDDLFGKVLSPAKKTSHSGNPWASVLISWFLVQREVFTLRESAVSLHGTEPPRLKLVLFSGKLNTIASIVTIFFLLVYAAVDVACLALEWASAPNFRPTFRYFTWHTCVLGIVGCAVMMFLINAIYASASIAFMLLLLLLIHYLSPTSSWGYISQALIFHQVRKYLLMLDVRKDHVKFWRPQILLMVSNPRSSVGLITFINDIKKSGLYVLGHVQLGDLNTLPSDPLQSQYDSWLSLVDHLNIKAFVNLTLADSVRHGIQHLLFISGLGGMRPNTLVLGFYDDSFPRDMLIDPSMSTIQCLDHSDPPPPFDQNPPLFHFSPLRVSSERQDCGEFGDGKALGPQEYVAVIADAMKMLKNVVLARYFNGFDRSEFLSPSFFSPGKRAVYVDVWPVNLLRPDSSSYVDTCSLFLLQLACVLNMVRAWRKAKLRLFLCVEEGQSVRGSEEKLGQLLKELRIKAQVYPVPWDQQVALHWQRQGERVQKPQSPNASAEEKERAEEEEEEEYVNSFPSNATRLSDNYLLAVNQLILTTAQPAPAVRFLYLPRPPADTRRYATYLRAAGAADAGPGPHVAHPRGDAGHHHRPVISPPPSRSFSATRSSAPVNS